MRTFPRMRFLALVLLGLAITMPADAQQSVGVNAAVNVDANGTPPGGAIRRLVIGQEVVHNERITTDPKGQTQILFLDGSSVSVGPNADLIIDEFIYDPATGTGKMTLTVVQGAFRFVGGKLSKEDNAVSVHLGTATIGVRGGVFVADVQPGGKTEIVFVYGKEVTVSGQSGCSQQLYRQGFAVDIATPGVCPDSPHQAPPGSTAAILSQLDGSQGQSGGATTVPTNAMVANSALPNTISNNVTLSVQQANASAPFVAAPPTPTVTPPQVPQNQIQISSSQSQPFVASPPSPSSPSPSSPTPTPAPPTPTPTPPTPPAPTPPAPTPPAPQPVVVQIAGLVKFAPIGSTLGFTNQSANARVPYTGSITYPAGSGMQDGVATGAGPSGTVITLSPLTAGATTNVTAAGANGSATGIVTTSADGDFFYGNLTATGSGQQIFIMGGTPVAQSFYAPQPTTQILAFNVQPDATLGSNGQAQTIPYLPAAYGGTISNPSVSGLYVVSPPKTQFGTTGANGPARYLQASLAINGQGASQTAALVVNTGDFDIDGNTNQPVAFGIVRGIYYTAGNGLGAFIASGQHSVPDANNNSFLGGNTIDGFVLDQNSQTASSNGVSNVFSSQLANAIGYQSSSLPSPFNGNTQYAYNQPVTSTTLPTGIGNARTALNETGYFGGLMQFNSGQSATTPYVLTGTATLQTDPVGNRVAATFTGTNPFGSSSSGINSATLQFGSLTDSGDGRTAFIDNNTFAALESPNNPTVVNGVTLPTPRSSETTSSIFSVPSLALVPVTTLGPTANSWMPAGVTPCACQYLQWGYWTGQLQAPTSSSIAPTFSNRAYINTWIAGQPTVTMPTAGIGTYNGAAVGTVLNNGATYLAAGNFNQTYNFGNSTGTVNISNFDGASYTASVSGSGRTYTGTLTGVASRTGNVNGGFFGPNAVETGGAFNIQSLTGSRYLASGIFAGR